MDDRARRLGKIPGAASARAPGGADLRRWARKASVIGAGLAMIGPAPRGLRALGALSGGAAPGPSGLEYLSAMAVPVLVVATGLAVAATVEAKRAEAGAGDGAARGLGITWGLVLAGFGAVLLNGS